MRARVCTIIIFPFPTVDAVVETAEGHPSVYALHYQTSGDGETLAEPAMHTCRSSAHTQAAPEGQQLQDET
eukprot:14866946-Alexandrium_andersonii.AAC.1